MRGVRGRGKLIQSDTPGHDEEARIVEGKQLCVERNCSRYLSDEQNYAQLHVRRILLRAKADCQALALHHRHLPAGR